MKTRSVAETLGQAAKTRPALEPILRAFEPLFTARREAALALAPKLAGTLAACAGDNLEAPLLDGDSAKGLGPAIRTAAQQILPALLEQEAVQKQQAGLESLYLDPGRDNEREELLAAMLADDSAALEALATATDVPAELLHFSAGFIIGAVLRALAANLEACEFANWHKSSCPVCGKPPVLAWLSKKPVPEPSEFLAPGGGKKFLHCDFCGANWHFLRGVCPACGTQGEDAMQILGEEERRHERIDWCKNCRSYLPCIDLREIAGIPDLDAAALALMHLDIVAAEKELLPLKPSFWNMF